MTSAKTNSGRLFRKHSFWRLLLSLFALPAVLFAANVFAVETALTETQVKALCVLNFAKYVTWPGEAGGANAHSSMRIGVIGPTKVTADLKAAAKGKIVSGKPVEIVELSEASEARNCELLFVGGSDKEKLTGVLEKVKTAPVVTIGEDERFAEAGGMINFVVKENKVRFEVDLNAARLAGIQISSKLLSLADKVRGKQQP